MSEKTKLSHQTHVSLYTLHTPNPIHIWWNILIFLFAWLFFAFSVIFTLPHIYLHTNQKSFASREIDRERETLFWFLPLSIAISGAPHRHRIEGRPALIIYLTTIRNGKTPRIMGDKNFTPWLPDSPESWLFFWARIVRRKIHSRSRQCLSTNWSQERPLPSDQSEWNEKRCSPLRACVRIGETPEQAMLSGACWRREVVDGWCASQGEVWASSTAMFAL